MENKEKWVCMHIHVWTCTHAQMLSFWLFGYQKYLELNTSVKATSSPWFNKVIHSFGDTCITFNLHEALGCPVLGVATNHIDFKIFCICSDGGTCDSLYTCAALLVLLWHYHWLKRPRYCKMVQWVCTKTISELQTQNNSGGLGCLGLFLPLVFFRLAPLHLHEH